MQFCIRTKICKNGYWAWLLDNPNTVPGLRCSLMQSSTKCTYLGNCRYFSVQDKCKERFKFTHWSCKEYLRRWLVASLSLKRKRCCLNSFRGIPLVLHIHSSTSLTPCKAKTISWIISHVSAKADNDRSLVRSTGLHIQIVRIWRGEPLNMKWPQPSLNVLFELSFPWWLKNALTMMWLQSK